MSLRRRERDNIQLGYNTYIKATMLIDWMNRFIRLVVYHTGAVHRVVTSEIRGIVDEIRPI